ncbi:MAG TPA: HNH endonuclease signature motif containing protein [Tepidisphaeraceae bacterium]|nr:HNH endonuclease signature motif containing protein [Tepidisphaeraceae bacterium]
MNPIEQLVRDRAAHRCEYCRLPEKFSKLKFVLDHIVARQHAGGDVPGNLALACGFCNRHKGPNIAGIDAETGQLVQLFNPRQDQWTQHFVWAGATLIGLTPAGRVTIALLAMNHEDQVAVREAIMDEGVFLS